jgi:hypothetical protein
MAAAHCQYHTLEAKGRWLAVRIYDNTFRNNRSNHIKLANNAEVFIENNNSSKQVAASWHWRMLAPD